MKLFRFCSFAMICCVAASMAHSQKLHNIVVANNGYYTVDYDTQLLCPRQVSWMLKSNDIGNAPRSSSWKFKTDTWLKPYGITHEDYTHSGFHRGHMCPAQDRSLSPDSMKQTFFLSNVCAQLPSVNCGRWLESENICRALAIRYDSIYIVALPLFLHGDTLLVGPRNVAVPHAFVKLAYRITPDTLLGWWFVWNR